MGGSGGCLRTSTSEQCSSTDPPSVHSSLRSKTPSLRRSKQTSSTKYCEPMERGIMFGETKHQLETCLKEHKDACIKVFTYKSAIAKHTWTEDNIIPWDDTRIVQCASQSMGLISREGNHLHMNGTRELVLQSWLWLQCIQQLAGVQEDQRWTLHRPHPSNHIVLWRGKAHTQSRQL